MDNDPLEDRPDVAAEQAAARERMAERRDRERPFTYEIPPGQLGVSCAECGDSDWVNTGDTDTTPSVRPCSRCQPELYERWFRGHLSTAHGQAGRCQDPDCRARFSSLRRRTG